MAVQTKQFCRISSHDQVIIEVFEEYHDDDYRTINDEGEPCLLYTSPSPRDRS